MTRIRKPPKPKLKVGDVVALFDRYNEGAPPIAFYKVIFANSHKIKLNDGSWWKPGGSAPLGERHYHLFLDPVLPIEEPNA